MKKPSRARPPKSKKYLSKPTGPGAWWAVGRDGEEYAAAVKFHGPHVLLHAKILGFSVEGDQWAPLAELRDAGFDHWRKRTIATQPAARWADFMLAADRRIIGRGGYVEQTHLGLSVLEIVAAEIVAHGEGEAFLKAARRGRSTQRQNARYQILREVERLMGDAVPRRRADANTPDALAIKRPVALELGLP